MFFGGTMLLVALAVMMAVSVTNIYARKDGADRVPRWTLCLTSPTTTCGGGVCCGGGDRCGIHIHAQGHRPADCRCHGQQGGVTRSMNHEASSINASDSRCCYCGTGEVRCVIKRTGEEDLEARRREEEWKNLAHYIDRIYFWLFLVLSGASQGVLFMKMKFND